MYIINLIKNDLAKKVEYDTIIKYKGFLELYKPYKKLIPETVFATEVMNIAPANFHSLKSGGTYKIKQFLEFDSSLIELLRDQMESRFKKSTIEYDVFRQIYEEYKQIFNEEEFAKKIFNINDSFFKSFKKKLCPARVFQDDENLFLKHYNNLYDKFYLIYKDHEINYQQFLELHALHAPFLTETDYAVCLGLNLGTYNSIKKRRRKDGSGTTTKLFYNRKIDYSNINLDELQKLYRNRKINYYDFQEIYSQYGTTLKEDEFARLLGIGFNTFDNFKRKKTVNLIIFKKNLSAKEENEILFSCRKKGLTRRLIGYNEFLEYYEPYSQYVNTTDFAYIIGLKQKDVSSLKEGKKALALDFIFSNQIVNMIKQELLLLHGTEITYVKFLKLYEKYSEYMSEIEFCYILGFSLSKYYKFKKNSLITCIIDIYAIERRIIKHQLLDNKMYSLADFEELAKMVELSTDQVISLYIGEDKKDVVLKYLDALNKNNGLYLGNIPLQDTSIAEEIVLFCKNYAKAVCIKLNCLKYADDIASKAIVHILENCGSYEINFGKDWFDFYKPYLVGIMKIWSKIQKFEEVLSLDAAINKNDKVRNRYNFISKPNNDYLDVDDFFDQNEDLYSQFINAINYGLEINEILSLFSQRFGKEPQEVLNEIKNIMVNQNYVQENIDGTVKLIREI